MIIESLIKKGSEILKKNNIYSHQIDAELLLSKVIKKDKVFLLTNSELELSKKEYSNYLNLIRRRQRYEPLSYITRNKEFWSIDFSVNNNVLIPRPETEIIVEQVLKRFRGREHLNILDIGTGSGCILLSILQELKKSYGVGIDKSFKAVNIAKKNSKKLNLSKRTRFLHYDIDNFNFGNYDIVVSNPPYIRSYQINSLDKDIKGYEPKMALDGGSSGLETISKVIIKAKKLLKVRGCLFIEIGNGQSNLVSNIIKKSGLMLTGKIFDCTKTVRCIISTRII